MAFLRSFIATLTILLLLQLAQACGFHSHGERQLEVDFSAIAELNNNARLSLTHSALNKKRNTKIAIDNVRVFDGSRLLSPATVVIDGDVIGTDPTGATQQIDGNGSVLLAGLIDSHVHPANITHLQDLSSFGVTTAFSMACFSPQMCQSLQNHTGLVDIHTSSAPAAAPGSAHGNIILMIDPSGSLLVYNATQATKWVDTQVAWNPDYIKLIAESPGLDQNTLNALVTESHRLGKNAVCHAAAFDAYSQAMTAGVDQIHHVPLDRPITSGIAADVHRKQQISTPTLTMMQAISNNYPSFNYSASRESVRLLHCAGVPILAGTDANLQPGIIANVPFGSSTHLELELLVEAGLSTVDALQAATSRAAKYWGLDDRGVIAPGKRADLLLIDGDPVADIKATRNIRKVWLAGVEYEGTLGTFTE